MKSATDAFEDAEIAREEARALRGALMNVLCNAINYPPEVRAHILGRDLTKLIDMTVDELIARGYTRQSPANTTTEDAWAEGYSAGWDDALAFASRQSPASTTAADAWDACLDAIEEYELNTEQARQGNPYRVAAPEGDGGNE